LCIYITKLELTLLKIFE